MSAYHSIERTSPKGQKFIGVCSLCGTPNLTTANIRDECANQRGLTQDEALIEAILPPGSSGADSNMPKGGCAEANPGAQAMTPIEKCRRALESARYYIDRLERVQRRLVVRDMAEAMSAWEHDNREALALTQEQEQGGWQVGQQVEKYTGDYQLAGEVRAVFTTKAGKLRYVVEHEPGFLHIYSPSNVRSLPPPPGSDVTKPLPNIAGYTVNPVTTVSVGTDGRPETERERVARQLAEANRTSWTSLSETNCIELGTAVGTKPFWYRLADAAIAALRSPPAPAVSEEARQHMAWLYQYVRCMTDENWRDMRLHCERQLDELAAHLQVREEEVARLRTTLMKAYQFISPNSDPMKISNTAMAAEIMAQLQEG